MKKVIIIIVFFLSYNAQAQNDTLLVKTSAVCGTCKKTIEHDLSFVKGIVSSDLNFKTKELIVVYDSKKIDANTIRVEVTKVGYDADSLKANPKAFRRLPECCKKPHNE